MSTLVTDTLKVKGDGNIPVALAKDVHVDYDDTDLETALEPATDTKLGLIKTGNNMDINADGVLSTINRVEIAKQQPIDKSLTWVDNTVESNVQTSTIDDTSKIIMVSKDPCNTLTSQDDGLYGCCVHYVRSEPTWHYYIDGIMYLKGYPITLTKSITIYLDANGDDTYGDGTAAHPRRTLGGLPRDFGGYNVTVHVTGDYCTSKSDFNIGYFAGGCMFVYMDSNPKFYRLQIYGNASRIYVYNAFTVDMSAGPATQYSGWTQAFYIGGNNFVALTSTNTTTKGTTVTVKACGKNSYTATTGATAYYRGFYAEGTALYINAYINFVCTNGRQAACFGAGHRMNVRYLTCKDSYYGLGLGYGKVGFDSITFSGCTTNLNIYHGGRAYTGAQSSIGVY